MEMTNQLKLKLIQLVGMSAMISIYSIVFLPFYFIVGFSSLYYVVLFSACMLGISLVITSTKTWFRYRDSHIDEEDASWYYNKVSEISDNMNSNRPRISLIRSDVPNAYAIDALPMKPVIVLTTGLIDRLEDDEMESVIAHEISHIKSYDIFLMTFLSSFTTFFRKKYNLINSAMKGESVYLYAILLPLVLLLLLNYFMCLLIFYGISRVREHFADIDAAREVGEDSMKSALTKITEGTRTESSRNRSLQENEPLCIIPISESENNLARTHPTLDKRIEKIDDALSDK